LHAGRRGSAGASPDGSRSGERDAKSCERRRFQYLEQSPADLTPGEQLRAHVQGGPTIKHAGKQIGERGRTNPAVVRYGAGPIRRGELHVEVVMKDPLVTPSRKPANDGVCVATGALAVGAEQQCTCDAVVSPDKPLKVRSMYIERMSVSMLTFAKPLAALLSGGFSLVPRRSTSK